MNILFTLAGVGWATINVNSYPMVVELSRGGDVGKYTGFYYTASMAAQTITPIFSGLRFMLEEMQKRLNEPAEDIAGRLNALKRQLEPEDDGFRDVED